MKLLAYATLAVIGWAIVYLIAPAFVDLVAPFLLLCLGIFAFCLGCYGIYHTARTAYDRRHFRIVRNEEAPHG